MGLLPGTQTCELRMRRESRERFPRHPGLAILTCITTRAWCTCHGACRDRLLAVSFEVGGGGNTPGISGACTTRNFAYLLKGPYATHFQTRGRREMGRSLWLLRRTMAARYRRFTVHDLLTHLGRATITQISFTNAFSWIKRFLFNVYCKLFPRFQLIIWLYWFM